MLKSLLLKRAGYLSVSGPKYIRYLLPLVVMAVMAGFLLWHLSPPYYLVIADAHGQELLSLPLTKEESFQLYYRHSVHRTPVMEIFQVSSQGELCLVATEFSTFGVGTPFLPEEGELKEVDGKFVLEGLQRVFPEIRIRPLELTENQLLYRDQVYPLVEYAESGSLIILKVRPGKPAKLSQYTDKGGMIDEP